MKTYIKHYPSPPRQHLTSHAKIALAIYGTSAAIMLSIIAFGIYSYVTK